MPNRLLLWIVLIFFALFPWNPTAAAGESSQPPAITYSADPDPWEQTNGPAGGVIYAVEIDPLNPNIIYAAGAGGGVYKSVNGGSSWALTQALVPPGDHFFDILISPKDPRIIYALGAGGRLFKSANSGATWQRIAEDKPMTCLSLYPDNPSLLVGGGWNGQVFRSQDGGATWDDITANLPLAWVQDVVIGGENEYWVGKTNNNGSAGGNLYHTTSGGASWSTTALILPNEAEVHTILVDPVNPAVLYLGLRQVNNEMFDPQKDTYLLKTTDRGVHWSTLRLASADGMVNLMGFSPDGKAIFAASGGNWLFRTTDSGLTWTQLNIPQHNGDLHDIAVDPKNPKVLYLPRMSYGIVKSADGGLTWKEINQGLRNVSVSLLAAPKTPGSTTLYATAVSGEGTFRSDDRGFSWARLNESGITHPWADELVVSPHNPNEVWEVADVGVVFRSLNQGATWNQVINTRAGGKGFRFGSIYALALAPSNPDIIYGLKNGFGIFKSTSGGMGEWTFLHGSEVDYTYSIAVHPTNPDIVYSGYSPKPFQDWATVRKSADGGGSWSSALTVPGSSGVTSVVIDPKNPEMVYAGSIGKADSDSGRIYRTTNGGSSWSLLNEHFTMLTVWGQPQLIASSTDPSTVFAATWLGGTWKTSDAGATWTLLNSAPLSATSLSVDPAYPTVIYSTDRTGPWVWKSADGGTHWSKTGNFTTSGAFLTNRVLVAGSAVYVSTFGPSIHGGRFYRSLDGGTTWKDLTGTLPRSVLDVAIDPSNPKVLYVTTHIHGAYKSTDGGATWAEMRAFPNIGGYDIEIDPANPQVIYAAGMGAVTVPAWVMPPSGYTLTDSSGVYKSTNGGASWSRILATGNEARAVRLHPVDHNLIFAASLDGGLQMSPDGGATWKAFNAGLDTPALTSLVVTGDKLYVGTQGCGVYSADFNLSTKTLTWQPGRSNKPVPTVHSLQISVDQGNSNRIYVGANPGGLFRSDDGGATFYDKNFLTPSVVVDDPARQGYYTYAINPTNPSEIWLGTWGKGIYKSYDGMDFDIGANGTNQMMMGKNIQAILVHKAYGVLAATDNGIYRSADGGQTWVTFNAGLGSKDVRVLAAGSAGQLYAGTRGDEIYRYDAQKSAWQQAQAFDSFGTFWPIWNNRPLYQYTTLAFHPTDPNTIFFGIFPTGIFKSTDKGQTWRESNTGWGNDGVFSLLFHPQNPKIIYAGTYNGINRTTDGGEHWTTWANGWPPEQWVFSIDYDPRNPNVMYACSKNGENEGTGRQDFHGTVMKSTDGGATWFPIMDNLDPSQEFYKIIVDRLSPDRVYLATQWSGVYLSEDGGAHWRPWNDGLTNPSAGTNGNNVTNTMLLSADGYYLYFGTAGSGVFRRETIRMDNRIYLPWVGRK